VTIAGEVCQRDEGALWEGRERQLDPIEIRQQFNQESALCYFGFTFTW